MWYLVNSSIAAQSSTDSLVDTLLDLWQPHCEKFPHSPCVKLHAIVSYLPAIDERTGRGFSDSGGPISDGFRRASFKFCSETWHRGSTYDPGTTIQQGTQWKHFVLAPAYQKFSDASYFNQADHALLPGEWGKRFWGEENYCKLGNIKKKYDPDLTFLCHQCVGNEIGFQPGQD